MLACHWAYLHDVNHARHLAIDQHTMAFGLELGQQLVQRVQLARVQHHLLWVCGGVLRDQCTPTVRRPLGSDPQIRPVLVRSRPTSLASPPPRGSVPGTAMGENPRRPKASRAIANGSGRGND